MGIWAVVGPGWLAGCSGGPVGLRSSKAGGLCGLTLWRRICSPSVCPRQEAQVGEGRERMEPLWCLSGVSGPSRQDVLVTR